MIATASNHRVKKLLLACCLGTAAVVAQAHPGRVDRMPPDPGKIVERMQLTLQLSDSQVKQIKSIFEDSAKQRKALEQKYRIAEREAFAADLKALREQTRAKVDAVLTDSQKKAREAQRSHRKSHHGEHGKRHHHHHCGPHGKHPGKQPALEKAS